VAKLTLRALATAILLLGQAVLPAHAAFAAESVVGPPLPDSPFLERFPNLKPLLLTDPETRLHIGFGATPLSFMPGKVAVGISALQVHYIDDSLDWEIFNASVDLAVGGGQGSSRHFVFRTAPKYRIFQAVSVGPLAGYEYVTYPNILAEISKGGFVSNPEPFSAQGLIFGGQVCESLPLKESRIFRVTETVYRQTYTIDKPTADSFGVRFVDPALELDPEKAVVKAGTIFQIEFSLLF
jgi:hypothetical protein